MFWKENHFQILRKYWHTESEHDTAARVGVSRKACLQASYRLAAADSVFLTTVKNREDDYLFEIVGDMRASVGNFQGWSDDQVSLLRQLWHTDLDSRVSKIIGKQKKACVGMALRLRDRDPEFAAAIKSRELDYRVIANQARRENSSAARWSNF